MSDGWTEERDGYTHAASKMRVVTSSPSSYAVLDAKSRQVRTASGRAQRWRNLDNAKQFVEGVHAEKASNH